MAFDRHGNLIACADMYGELWKIRPDGSSEVLVNNYRHKMLNGPNDVWINPVNGGMGISWIPSSHGPSRDADDPRQQPWEPTHPRRRRKAKVATSIRVLLLVDHPAGVSFVRVTTEALGWESDSLAERSCRHAGRQEALRQQVALR